MCSEVVVSVIVVVVTLVVEVVVIVVTSICFAYPFGKGRKIVYVCEREGLRREKYNI